MDREQVTAQDTSVKWDRKGIRERCRTFRQSLLLHEAATQEELDAYWPGGSENKGKDFGAWVYCYGSYRVFLDREYQILRNDPNLRAQADRLLTDALRSEPITVERVELGAEGRPRYLQIHPKSLNVLVDIDQRDRWIQRLAAVRQVLFARAEGDDVETVAQLTEEILHQHRIIVTILTHPGPGSPFEDHEAEPAASLADLDAMDVLRAMQAHHRIHRERLQAVTLLFEPGDQPEGKGRGSWATLLALAADKMSIPAPMVSKNYALEAVCAQLYTTAEASREAHEHAKQEAKRGAR